MASKGSIRDHRLALSSAKATVTHLKRKLYSLSLTDSERALARARLLSAQQLVEQLDRDAARERSAA